MQEKTKETAEKITKRATSKKAEYLPWRNFGYTSVFE